MTNLLKLKEVAMDMAQGRFNGGDEYSVEDGNKALRQELINYFGTDKLTYRQYRRDKVELFELIEDTITPAVQRRLEDVFYDFAEFDTIPYGDQKAFDVPNPELFRVGTIAEGEGNIRRTRIESGRMMVTTHSMATGFYEELVRFIAGRVDWADLVDRVVRSFERDMAQRIAAALYGSFNDLNDLYGKSIAASKDTLKEEILEIASHVEAEHGSVVILGTKTAVAKLEPKYHSDAQAGERNNRGYFGVVDGYEVISMPQIHKPGTDEFAVKDDMILILPNENEKLVKVVLEGEAIVREANGTESSRSDMQMQHDVIQRAGVGVMTPNKYGMVKLT